MLDGSLESRKEYIKNSNELNKISNLNAFVKGNKQKVELDQKLEELSIRTGTIVSGNVVRKNIIDSSASKRTTINNLVDLKVYEDSEEEKKKNKEIVDFEINKGKKIIEDMKKNDKDLRSFK